jgi:NADH dehydrogenase
MQIRVPKVNLPRVVIVGGGFGGIELAKRLKNKPFQVVLLNKNNYLHT